MGRLGLCLVIASIFVAGPGSFFTAAAQESVSGVLNAQSFQPVPEGLPILVRPLDDSKENLAIKSEIEQALVRDGFAVATESSFVVLSFETRRELGGGSTPRRQVETQSAKRNEGTGTGTERYKPKLEGPREGASSVGASRFRLDATLDDTQERKRLWRGWTIVRLQGDDTTGMVKVMVPVLMGSLGETVREQTFDIAIDRSGAKESR